MTAIKWSLFAGSYNFVWPISAVIVNAQTPLIRFVVDLLYICLGINVHTSMSVMQLQTISNGP